jgi:hypothetical protein
MERTRLLRNICVSHRDSLCGVALFMPFGYHASVSSLDSLDLAQKSRSLGLLKKRPFRGALFIFLRRTLPLPDLFVRRLEI